MSTKPQLFVDEPVLSKDQEDAVGAFMSFLLDPDESEMVISGPSGSGKTWLTKFLLRVAREDQHMLKLLSDNYNNLNVVLTSTTNKAATILEESTGEETRTIHSLLGLKVQNDFKTGKVKLKKSKDSEIIHNTIIFCDEISMANSELIAEIRKSTINCKFIGIGDANQINPVFETSCPAFVEIPNQTHLTSIQRQCEGNPIIELGQKYIHALKTGKFDPTIPECEEIIHVDGEGFRKEIHNTFNESWDVNHGRVVAWTNSRVNQYNQYIRGLHTNSTDYEVGEYLLTNQPILDGTKVIAPTDSIHVISDIYAATIDDIPGHFISLNGCPPIFQAKDRDQVKSYLKRLAAVKDWENYFRVKDNFADLRPIYACTAHKSQGSTYDTVLVDLDDIGRNNKNDEIARLMYVACTRAKHKVVLTGKLPARLYK